MLTTRDISLATNNLTVTSTEDPIIKAGNVTIKPNTMTRPITINAAGGTGATLIIPIAMLQKTTATNVTIGVKGATAALSSALITIDAAADLSSMRLQSDSCLIPRCYRKPRRYF